MFVDEATIRVASGAGGNGCMAFRREKFVPRGGPSGGDGGRGGDVIMEASERHNTLVHFRFNPEYKAQRGRHGEGSNRTGPEGKSITLKVPVGTMVYNDETGELVHDFARPNESMVIAKGGRGGRGNQNFATPTHQAPREHEHGQAGRGAAAAAGAEAAGRRGTGGLSECGQVHADLAHLGGASEDCGLSVHHAAAQSGSGGAGRDAECGQLRGG